MDKINNLREISS